MATGSASIVTSGVLASGGTVSAAGGYTYHTFTTDGTFTLSANPSNLPIDVIVVGGGGGGGSAASVEDGGGGGGGGGGGRVAHVQFTTLANASYSIVIGAGGTAGSNSNSGGSGGTSTFSTIITAPGGGGGGGVSSNGLSGGSGGGGGMFPGPVGGSSSAATIASGTILQNIGNAGGSGGGLGAGGGGGALGAGGNGTDGGGGAGGNGYLVASFSYGGGGGGAGQAGGPAGNGGGQGAGYNGNPATNASWLGGGGGGGFQYEVPFSPPTPPYVAGAGASGAVIVSFASGSVSSTFTPPAPASALWVNGIQPASNYCFQSLYVSGGAPSSWNINASFTSPGASGPVTFYYGYIQ